MTKLCDELNQKRKSLSFCKSTEESKKKKKEKKLSCQEKTKRL